VFTIFDDKPNDLPPKLIRLSGVVIAANLFTWGWAYATFRNYPLLLATASIAYGFGLRHAVDADHIAAIDNVTRKLMLEGKRPISAGFFFSLGHSTVVFAASLMIASAVGSLRQRFPELTQIGADFGTLISALFLFAIAAINVLVLAEVLRISRLARRGNPRVEEQLDRLLAQRGLLGRLLRRTVRLMSQSWQMYPLGLLFGLGFDTATEIGLLGISAAEASEGLSIWAILVFPALFTARMSLVDTGDGILMVGAYGWAYVNPTRKLWYNLALTAISVGIAVAVGTVEACGLVAEKFGLAESIAGPVSFAADHFGAIGILVIGLFLASWLGSIVIYRGIEPIGLARLKLN